MKFTIRFIVFFNLIIIFVILATNSLLFKFDKLDPARTSSIPVLNKISKFISIKVEPEEKMETSSIVKKYIYRNGLVTVIALVIVISILTPLIIRPFIRMSVETDKMNRNMASVTHELRSPLASINMYVDLFFKGAAGSLNETQKEFLTIIKGSARRLTEFINDYLDMAKIEQGKMIINKQPFDLRKNILEMLELIRPQAHEKKIKLELVIPSGLPKVLADPDRTKQVITNLVGNAIKFTPEKKSIVVEVRDIKVGYIQVSVIDTGIGIPKNKLDSVFEKYVQVNEAKKKTKGPKGTGLGLPISKAIVEMQKGKIWVESEPGKGTKFHFTIPRYG